MTHKVDYDSVASSYDRRYVDNEYPGTEQCLRQLVAAGHDVLEVGCGTGHWLAQMRAWGARPAGVEPSRQMLARAAARGLELPLARGRAEALPFRGATFDRIVCINALHHVPGKTQFIAEARRVLRPGGTFLSIGLDPAAGPDPWCIYDYFETTLALDRGRYPACADVRAWLSAAGFVDCRSSVAERIVLDRDARECLDRGLLAKASTSQLALLTDEQYRRGIDRIRADANAAAAEGRSLRLTGDLRLYATFATAPAG